MRSIRFALVGAAICTAAAAAPAFAQAPAAPAPAQQGGGQGGGQGRGGNMMTAIMAGITLSPAQQAKADSIVAKYQPQQMALRTEMQNGGDRAEIMTKMQAIRKNQTDELKGVLTAEQKVVFDKNAADMEARRAAGGGQGGQRPPVA
ncbi:MAG: hypothetical protein JWO05_2717 [Gemmatimonadetes bacterium]|nr:hypothetical protein [Gemmatimonadota bacterium]